MLELLIVGALSVGSAAQAPESTRPVASSGHAAPYERLFTVAPITAPGVPAPKSKPDQPPHRRHTVVVHPQWRAVERGPCNMPIIVGNASADPGILIPRQHSHQFKIRVMQPPACGPR